MKMRMSNLNIPFLN